MSQIKEKEEKKIYYKIPSGFYYIQKSNSNENFFLTKNSKENSYEKTLSFEKKENSTKSLNQIFYL